MADNVSIDPGSTTAIATDDIGGIQFQRVKLAAGADGAHAGDVGGRAVDGGSAAALYTDQRTELVRVQVTPTITAGAYTADDVVGGELTFASVVRASGGTAEIRKVLVTDKAAVKANFDLFLFDAAFSSSIADNVAWAPAAAELLNLVAIVPIYAAEYADMGTAEGVSKPLAEAVISDATGLTGYLVDRDGKTFASTSDLTITLLIAQD